MKKVGLAVWVGAVVTFAAISRAQEAPTAAQVEAFLKEVEEGLLDRWIGADRAEWVRMTYITEDTEAIAASAREDLMDYVGRMARKAMRFLQVPLSDIAKRKIHLLRTFLDMPAPPDAAKREELAQIGTRMDSIYGQGKHCPQRLQGKCLTLPDMYEVLAKSRDYDELLDIWTGWRKVSVPMRPLFQRFVELSNEGAQALGFSNLAELWKSRYDMPPDAFEAETERLWKQVEPLYRDLHCYVRAKLTEKYGADRVPPNGPIPAHLLGNMWAQEWTNLFDLVAPEPAEAAALDLDAALQARGVDEKGMVRIAEAFFVSLGLEPLPATFWERSMFTQPRDRDVVCHASAWDVDQDEDLRIKMCIRINAEDFTTIHHELGHNYYQRAYRELDPLFRNSANDGFHEALGDLIALSVTPSYLKAIGLIQEPPAGGLNALMQRALEKVAFLPFGLLVDRWRWAVFEGRVGPGDYNRAWWDLRTRYQGVAAPVARSEQDFDPGAKYHVPANVPYTRYFLAAILQFQFHRALCRNVLHFKGPLHECSIYGNKEAGARIRSMMELGMSRPWPEALEVLTGETRMDASALTEYFAPLHQWLKKQNRTRKCGW